MKRIIYFLFVSVMIMTACEGGKEGLKYPVTAKVDTVDNYFGVDVPDPYRWLEDDNSDETAEWVKAQNAVTFGYLKKIPYRERIGDRLTEIWNYPKYGTPFKKGNKFFMRKNDGMQNHDVLYVMKSLDAEPEVLLDPNTLSDDGTIALGDISISKDGKYMAYSLAASGSDWNEIHFMEIATRNKLEEVLHWVKFSAISWQGDGVYYGRYDTPDEGDELTGKNEFHKAFYHKIGTAQEEDVLIYENKEFPLRIYNVIASEDEQHLLLYEYESSTGNALYYRKADDTEGKFTTLIEGFEHENSVIDNIGDKVLIKTDIDAPRGQLVLIDPSTPENWKIIIPEGEDVLEEASIIYGRIVARYMHDASSRAFIFDLEGNKLNEIELPGIGTMFSMNGNRNDSLMFYSYTSFTFPASIFVYDLSTNENKMFKESELDFNAADYLTEQVFYESKDGTKVPMFIVHHKDVVKDGNNPTLLYGYGGFNISLTPAFSISRLIFLENGGIVAIPNLRGGGEYGEDWHMAGTKLKKQNVFDDFIAAAEYLIAENYTNSDKLAIHGGSNGGLLVGACMTQRPELFEVAIPAVGVMDMLRFHKFTIGWAWTGDYGSSDNEEEFHYLLGYSPLHNLKAGVEYPATMVMTADHDDRVVPAHSFKFAATLQEMHGDDDPVIIRIETKAGHGAGKPTAKKIEEATDLMAFLFYNLDMDMR